jgi:hypothetical protein
MGTNGGGGEVDEFACRCDDCKPYWSRVEIPTWFLFFLLIFVQIYTYHILNVFNTNYIVQIHTYTNCITT